MSGLLRLATCGSVDDGKSTLIGRLLHDTRQIADDQLEHVRDVSERRGGGELDLALLTDGLRAEREQGITIDVAYRYFQVAGRKVILADTPGHEQYTRNMVTGASTADLGLVLVDARTQVLVTAPVEVREPTSVAPRLPSGDTAKRRTSWSGFASRKLMSPSHCRAPGSVQSETS